MEFLRFNTTTALQMTQAAPIIRHNNCNGITVVNTGDDVAFVNQQILYPGNATKLPGGSLGDTLILGGNFGEIYLGDVQLSFAGIGANPEVMVTQKFYILDETIY